MSAAAGRVPCRWWLGVGITNVLLALLLFRRGLFTPHSSIGLGGDPYLFQWWLAWVAHALTHGLNPLFSHFITAPAGQNLMYNTSMPLAGAVLAPITATAGPLLSYNILIVAGPVLSAMAAFAAAARFVTWRPAALVAGVFYGFSPYMVSQSLGHPMLTMAWFPPVVVIITDSVVRKEESSIVLGVVLGAAAVTQLLLGLEVLLTSALLAVIAVLVWVLAFRHDAATVRLLRRGAPTVGVAAVTAGVLGAFPVYMLLFGGQSLGTHAPVQPTNVYVNDVMGFVVPGRMQLLSTGATRSYVHHFPGNFVESTAYLGIPLVALLGYYLYARWQDRRVRLPIVAAGLLAVLSLGGKVHVGGSALGTIGPAAALDGIPVLWNILPSRLMLYGYLAVALALAAIIDGRSSEGRWSRAAMVCACVAFVLPATLPAFHETSTPDAFRLSAQSGGSILVTPAVTLNYEQMIWQAETNFSVRLVGGFTLIPRSNPLLDTLAMDERENTWSPLSGDQVVSLRRAAAQLGVTTVLDAPGSQAAQRRAVLAAVFGPPEPTVDGFAVWHVNQRLRPQTSGGGNPT